MSVLFLFLVDSKYLWSVFNYLKEQSPVECNVSRNKRLRSLPQEENTADNGESPGGVDLDDCEKEDIEEEEEDNKRKV